MNILIKRLDEIVERTQKINEYDYNNVMKNLVRTEIQNMKKKEKSKQYLKASKRWKNKVINCKKTKEELEIERKEKITSSIQSKIMKRNHSSDNLIASEHIWSQGSISTHSRGDSNSNSEYKKIKLKVHKSLLKDEKSRQVLELTIKNRLERLTKQNEKNKKHIKIKFAEKFETYHKILENKKLKEQQQFDLIKAKESDDIERFRVYQIYLQQQRKKYQIIKEKEKTKAESIEEKFKEIEINNEEKRKELEEKMKIGKMKKMNNLKLNSLSYLHDKESLALEKFRENSKSVRNIVEKRKREVLDKETNIYEKYLKKERSIDMSRSNLQ